MNEQEKRENTIKGLECCGYSRFMDKCQECPYDGKDCFHRLKTDAIALLKAQEPVKPKMMEFVDEGLTWEKYEIPTCGVCGAMLGDALFCPMCGRPVKWE